MNFEKYLSEDILEESIKKLKYTDLLLNKRSLLSALRDFYQGRKSQTTGYIELWKTDKGYIITDGWHRFVNNILLGKKEDKFRIIGKGYNDYWAIPFGDNIFILNNNKKYLGLEDIMDKKYLDNL